MKAGNFNINDYLERLYENAEAGNLQQKDQEGIIIPDENKKSYDWLKKEYQKSQTEVKVEITGQGASFKPGYDMQASTDSIKEFKPGIFGEVKTADTKADNKEDKPSLDSKKDKASFQPGEGEKEKKELPKTFGKKEDIKNKGKENSEEEEDSEEKTEKTEKVEKEKPEVKKIDLKTKKNDR